MQKTIWIFATLVVVSLAQGDLGPCDPLVPEACFLPFPNNFWLKTDSTTKTGHRVAISPETVPRDQRGLTFDTTEWNTLDGFSASASIQTFMGDVDISDLPGHWDISRSLDSDCPTVLLDTFTGLRVPHFAELDNANPNDANKTLFIWADRRLEDNHRYIVAIRRLRDTSGQLIGASPVFKALRDGTTSDDPTVEPRRNLFEDIFARLERIGVRRGELQIAWDFSTASLESVTGRMVAARDDAFSRLSLAGPAYRITLQQDEFSDTIYRKVEGMMTVPLYMNSPYPGSYFVLDENGLPVYQGTTEVRFTVLIPRSLVEQRKAGAILQYGHGLLGGQDEVLTAYLGEIANREGFVLCAVDWQGMSSADVLSIISMVSTDLGKFKMIPDRTTQGMINALLLMKMMMGDFSRDNVVTFGGISVIDPSLRYYYGNSQGGILGTTYMATSTDVLRGCVGVSGAPFGILLSRSVDFTPFYYLIKARYHSGLERAWLIGFLDMLWDRSEPSGYLNAITRNPLPNTPTKRVLLQYSLGDAQVSWLGLYFKARSLGAKFFRNNVIELNETIYGIETLSELQTADASVAVGYNFGAPPAPKENIPPNKDYDTHELTRRDIRAQNQMSQFFKTGIIYDTCDGQGCYGDAKAYNLNDVKDPLVDIPLLKSL